MQDEVPIVTNGAMQSIPENKHSVNPDIHFKVQLKSSIPEVGVPCPKHMTEKTVSFPCIVKVDMSWLGRGGYIVKNETELARILKEIREEYGWKDTVIFQEMIQGIKEVPGFQFYLQKSGEIYWVGTSFGGFNGLIWTGSVLDWDKLTYQFTNT